MTEFCTKTKVIPSLADRAGYRFRLRVVGDERNHFARERSKTGSSCC